MVEQCFYTAKVGGSNPSPRTNRKARVLCPSFSICCIDERDSNGFARHRFKRKIRGRAVGASESLTSRLLKYIAHLVLSLYTRRGSSVVEQTPEERRVGCSIHPRGTRKTKNPRTGIFCFSSFYSFFTLMRSERFLSSFGRCTVSKPFLSEASAPSTSISQGRSIEREKLPQ